MNSQYCGNNIFADYCPINIYHSVKKNNTFSKLIESNTLYEDTTMFNYFTNNNDADIQYPIKKYFKWNLVKKMYRGELEKTKDYYRNREYNFGNSNPLVRLVKTLSRSPDLTALEFLSYIDIDTEYIVKQFDFVSNLSSGKVLDNVLFSGDSREIFLYVDNAVDPMTFKSDWRTYESIKVVKTDITNINYPVLFRYDKISPGITVFEIDVKALMLQYYYWVKERLLADRDTAANVFIPTVVVPNISNSLVDRVIWNRFKLLATGEPIDNYGPKHPISLIDYQTGIDEILLDIADDNLDQSIYMSQLLKTIPAIIENDQYDAMQISKSYYNKQSQWALWVSRLEDIIDLHKMLGVAGYRKNRDLFIKLPYEVKQLNRRSTEYEDKLDLYNLELMKENIEYINKNIGKR